MHVYLVINWNDNIGHMHNNMFKLANPPIFTPRDEAIIEIRIIGNSIQEIETYIKKLRKFTKIIKWYEIRWGMLLMIKT